MMSLSWNMIRDRWTLFVGAILSVALGVALVHSSAAMLVAADAAYAPIRDQGPTRQGQAENLESINALMGMSIFLGMFLTVFIIGSTFGFTVVERRRELALLRLSGGSRRQLAFALVGEGVLLGVIGTGLGVALGLVATGVQYRLVAGVGLDVSVLHLRAPWWLFLVDLATGVGAALAGVLVATRRATRVRPLDALRDTGSQTRVMTPGRWCWGLLCGVPAVIGAFAVQTSSDLLTAAVVGMLIILAGSIALQQFSPLVLPLLARVFGLLAGRHVLGELAAGGIRDGIRRSATTAGPLIVLMGLVAGLFGILGTQTEATRVDEVRSSCSDLVLSSNRDVLDGVRAVPGVAVAESETAIVAAVRTSRGSRWTKPMSPPTITAVDPDGFRALTAGAVAHGRLGAFTPGTAVLGSSAGEQGIGNARQLRITLSGKTITRQVVAAMKPTIRPGSAIVISRADIPAEVLRTDPSMTFVKLTSGANAADVRAHLAAFGTVSTPAHWAATSARNGSRENNAVMWSLVGLGGLYAFLSSLNAVAVGTLQRKREFAVARVSGAARGQVIAASTLESVGVTLIGLLLGAAVAALALAGLGHATSAQLGVNVAAIPWRTGMGLAVLATAAVALTSAVTTAVALRPAPVTLVTARE